MLLMVHPNTRLSHPCLLPPFFFPLLFPRLPFPHSSLPASRYLGHTWIPKDKTHRSCQSLDPISSYLGLTQGLILALVAYTATKPSDL